jgi:AhpD family alkylhydroperoxidase
LVGSLFVTQNVTPQNARKNAMSSLVPMETDGQTNPRVQAVFDDIKATRKVTWVNNFWRVLASHAPTLERIWSNVKQVMSPGALDPVTKEMIYIAVSVTNNCEYCIHSHRAAAMKAGMTEEQFAELLAVVGLANETNRLANGYRIPVDEQFRPNITS